LQKSDKVKINLFFRGRQMEHVDIGRKVLDRFIADTQHAAQLEKSPAMEGRVMYFVLAPK
jgi:translation initiation factor IF-3